MNYVIIVGNNRVRKARNYGSNNKGLSIIKQMREYDKKYNTTLLKGGDMESDKKSERSIRRTRSNIYKVLESNLDDNSYFITLTFAKNIQDYDKANKAFNNWVYKNYKNLKYLNVKEHQKRGAIHFHLIVFDVDFNDLVSLLEKWSYHGFYYSKKITNYQYYSISNYFTKYLGKENQMIAKNKRIFNTSRNLKKIKRYDKFCFQHAMKNNLNLIIEEYDWSVYDNIEKLAVAWFGDDKIKII